MSVCVVYCVGLISGTDTVSDIKVCLNATPDEAREQRHRAPFT